MKKLKQVIIGIVLILCGAGLSFLLFPGREKVKLEPFRVETIIKDTVEKLVYKDPIIITKMKTKIIEKADTVVQAVPFTARIDTIIKYDTINARFEFPENLFSLQVRKKPDSALFETRTVFRTVEKEKPWWETPAYVIGGTVIGFLLGSMGK